MKFTATFLALLMSATPSLAFEAEEIGMIEASFGAETIAQPTVRITDGDGVLTTTFMFLAGSFSSLTIEGFAADNAKLRVEVDFFTVQPGPETAPLGLTIHYSPQAGRKHWTSDDAPSAPAVTFTVLEANDTEGRAIGTFAAELCFAEDYEGGSDPGNCRMIEGRFDTRFFIERMATNP
jgi:hypothetical protein